MTIRDHVSISEWRKKIPGNVQLQPGNPLSPIGPGPSILKHPVEHSPSSINLSLQAKREKLERLYKDVLHLKIRKRQRVWWLGWRYNCSQGTLMGVKTSQNWLPGITRRHFSGCVLVLGGAIESFPDFQSMWRLESIAPLLAPSLEMKTSYHKGLGLLRWSQVIASILFFSCWALLEDH